MASIKCKYHNEIVKLRHGIHGSNIFRDMPLFNDIQGGRRMDQLFIQYVLNEPCVTGFRYCDFHMQEMIFRLFITMMFRDIGLQHIDFRGNTRVADVNDL